jgi:uncharacterized damage-inducible protein DinB
MTATQTNTILSAEALLTHWQGHRRLTRRVIEAFPEEKLFNYSVGSMRPFSELVKEFLKMTVPVAHGVATGEWKEFHGTDLGAVTTKAELLKQWDEATAELDRIWATIPAHRWAEVDKAFGQWEGSGIHITLYCIDNELHHRGQGYVYLRSLGIEPPPFWERQ